MKFFNFFKKRREFKTDSSNYVFGEEYWNNKWEKAPILYGGRSLMLNQSQIAIDVTHFLDSHDAILTQVIDKYKLRKSTHNETALAVQKWVVRFMKYVGDKENSGINEFWQFAFETVQSGIGDCEDGAILMGNLLLNAGIPSWRVKIAAGYVQEAPTAPQGGHAYCLYLADDATDEKKLSWVVLDWCYAEDSRVAIENKPRARNGGVGGYYKDVWFTFNDSCSWAGHPIQIFDGRISKDHTVSKESVMKTNNRVLSTIITAIDRKIKNNR